MPSVAVSIDSLYAYFRLETKPTLADLGAYRRIVDAPIPIYELKETVQKLADAGFTIIPPKNFADFLKKRASGLRQVQASVAAMTGGKNLYPFQVTGITYLCQRKKAALFDEMGLGKTIQALMSLPNDARAVVVCPAVVKTVWQDEINAWRKDLKPSILSGQKSFRWPVPGEIVILNYEILPKSSEIPIECPSGVHLIADEAHYLKNRKAKRTGYFKKLVSRVLTKDGCAWALTGTPLMNKPPDLWNVLEAVALAREAFGSWTKFVKLFGGYENVYEGYDWNSKNISSDAAKRLSRVALRRQRAEVLPDLPAKTHRIIRVPRPKGEMLKQCDMVMQRHGRDIKEAIQKSDLAYLRNLKVLTMAKAALAEWKVPALLNLVQEYENNEEPVVVFSDHRLPIEILERRPGWRVVHGGINKDMRRTNIKHFQSGNLVGIGLTIGAGGTGITLTRSSQAVFNDLSWTPANNTQAEDRICRIGQDRGCVITHLVADHILDVMITTSLLKKQKAITDTVEAMEPMPGNLQVADDLEQLAAML